MKIVNKLQKIENYTHFIYIYYYNKSLDIKIKNRNLKLIMSSYTFAKIRNMDFK